MTQRRVWHISIRKNGRYERVAKCYTPQEAIEVEAAYIAEGHTVSVRRGWEGKKPSDPHATEQAIYTRVRSKYPEYSAELCHKIAKTIARQRVKH